MKEMEYKTNRIVDVLDTGHYRGYDYMIISYGTHPCAYVAIPENHPLYEQALDDIPDFGAHCGLSFCDHFHRFGNRFCIGWDYAHFGDYNGYSEAQFTRERKWTTVAILAEVKSVIDQMNEFYSKS
jgi:hypothetical protein